MVPSDETKPILSGIACVLKNVFYRDSPHELTPRLSKLVRRLEGRRDEAKNKEAAPGCDPEAASGPRSVATEERGSKL